MNRKIWGMLMLGIFVITLAALPIGTMPTGNAAGLSPATGDNVDWVPFAAVGGAALLVIVLGVAAVMKRNANDDDDKK